MLKSQNEKRNVPNKTDLEERLDWLDEMIRTSNRQYNFLCVIKNTYDTNDSDEINFEDELLGQLEHTEKLQKSKEEVLKQLESLKDG